MNDNIFMDNKLDRNVTLLPRYFIITYGVFFSVFLFILVEPHLNVDIPSSHEIIGLQNGTSLNITVNLLANPAPTIQWVFRKDSILVFQYIFSHIFCTFQNAK